MLIGIIVVIGLALMILGHEAGHFFAAKKFKMKVEEFGFGFPPRIFAKKKGETEYSFNWLPFGGFVRIAGENDRLEDLKDNGPVNEEEKKGYFYAQPLFNRSVVILAGIAINFLMAWLLLSGIYMVGTSATLLIGQVQEGSPAASAGIKPGDIVSGHANAEEFTSFINQNRGKEIEVKILREGEEVTIKAVPRIETKPGEGALGVGFQGIVRRNPLVALYDGFIHTVQLARYTFESLATLVSNLLVQRSLPSDVVGIVGIFPVAQQVGEAGIIYVVQLLALISINLAVINIMPFPALDGGRFLLLIIEGIKGSPLPRKFENWLNIAGFALLVTLMIAITIRDIARL